MSVKERILNIVIKKEDPLPNGVSVYHSVILLGKARGSHFSVDHPSLRYVLGSYEPEVTKAMSKFVHKGDAVFDIGAHAGYLSMHLSKLVGKDGKVFSFEPSDPNRELLERNYKNNSLANIVVLNYAVTDTNGAVRFILNSPSYGSHVVRDGENGNSMYVPSITIDEFIISKEGLPPTFIKLDVEGEELAALQGAVQTLESYHPVVVAEVKNDYLKPVQNLMEAKGYSYRVLSKPGSLYDRLGTPNVLFLPHR